jgi:hypothetical protein
MDLSRSLKCALLYRPFGGFLFAAAFLLRTSALLAAAFFARVDRSSGVIDWAAVLPPFFPCFLKKSNTSVGNFATTSAFKCLAYPVC